MRHRNVSMAMAAALGLALLPLGACEEEEPVEETFEETEDAMEDAGDEVDDAVDDAGDELDDGLEDDGLGDG